MTITDIDISTFEDLVVDQEPPCDCCTTRQPEYVLKVRKHEKCDDGVPVIWLACPHCKSLALQPDSEVICSACDALRPLPPSIISIDPL